MEIEKKVKYLKEKVLVLIHGCNSWKADFSSDNNCQALCEGKSDRNNLCKLSMKTVSEFFRENQIKSGWGSDSGNTTDKFKARDFDWIS